MRLTKTDPHSVFPEHSEAFNALKELPTVPAVDRTPVLAGNVGASAVYTLLEGERTAAQAAQQREAAIARFEALNRGYLETDQFSGYYDLNVELLTRVQRLFSRERQRLSFARTPGWYYEETTLYSTGLFDIGVPMDAADDPAVRLFAQGHIEVWRREDPLFVSTPHRVDARAYSYRVAEFGVATYSGPDAETAELQRDTLAPCRSLGLELESWEAYWDAHGPDGPKRVPPTVSGREVMQLLELSDVVNLVEDRLAAADRGTAAA